MRIRLWNIFDRFRTFSICSTLLAHFLIHRLVQCVRLYHVIFTSCSMNNVIQMQKLKYSHFSRKAPNQYRINIKENHRSIFVYNFVEIFKGILFLEISSFRLILLNSWTKIQVFALTTLLKMSLVENVRALEKWSICFGLFLPEKCKHPHCRTV